MSRQMRKISCIVVDDEPLAVEMLAGYVCRTPSLELAGSYTDPVQALSEIKALKPDVVFMDIQMLDLNGLELSRMLPSETRVMFTTAFRQYALESYEVEAIDYLLKPVRYQKFLEAVVKAEKWVQMRDAAAEKGSQQCSDERRSAFFKVDGQFRNIDFSDILYVSAMKDYAVLKLVSDSSPVVVHLTMKSIEDLLPSSHFMRVHRSYIVALDKISSIDTNGDIFLSDDLIPVSESYRKDVEAFLSSRLFVSRKP